MSIPWFKVLKFLLTVLRAILFLFVFIFSLSSANKPVITIISSLFFNFRLSVALIIVAICLSLLVIILILLSCGRSNRTESEIQDDMKDFGIFTIAAVTAIFFTFMALFWKYGDWPCFKKHRYKMLVFDAVHYGLFMVLTPIFGGIELGINLKNNNSSFVWAMILYFMYFILFALHFSLEILRLLRVKRVTSEICDILECNEPKNINASAVMSDSSRDMTCIKISRKECHNTDPEHWVRAHSNKDRFPIPNLNVRGEKFVVGFHQTDIKSAKAIIRTYMKPSSGGMLGAGIYFATSIQATNGKTNNKGGAFIVAKLNLKIIKIIRKQVGQTINDPIDSDGFDSVYLEYYQNGKRTPDYDEFTVKEPRLILDYVVYFSKDAVDSYRLENNIADKNKFDQLCSC